MTITNDLVSIEITLPLDSRNQVITIFEILQYVGETISFHKRLCLDIRYYYEIFNEPKYIVQLLAKAFGLFTNQFCFSSFPSFLFFLKRYSVSRL